jgi:two-component system, NtrC family, response regulator AtoC
MNILIAEDDVIMKEFLKDSFASLSNYNVDIAKNGQIAIDLISKTSYDIIITDMKMPYKNGLDVLEHAKKNTPKTIVIIMTAHGSISSAVEAMKKGAFHYLIKPFSIETLNAIFEKAIEQISLIKENQYLRNEIKTTARQKQIIVESPSMKNIFENIVKIAKSSSNVFIFGESGVGKEIVANAIHDNSNRSIKPFIKVNCAAIAENLLESEFFGHERGSFTGADFQKDGRFELADRGSLLLDEITEIPLSLQPKLLRAIQEKEFERVGGTRSLKVDIRFIATTNRDIKKAINEKTFREDLYYRLNVVPIHVPPLRERKEDILALAKYFVKRFCVENHKKIKVFTQSALNKIHTYPWPGNVRELANIIERAVVLDNEDIINENHIMIENISTIYLSQASELLSDEISLSIGSTLYEAEKKLLLETLRTQKFNRTKTAKILGISIRTLRNKLKTYKNSSQLNFTFNRF